MPDKNHGTILRGNDCFVAATSSASEMVGFCTIATV
jgi:hypothetical protein